MISGGRGNILAPSTQPVGLEQLEVTEMSNELTRPAARHRPLGITIMAVLLLVGGVVSILLGTELAGITKFGVGQALASAGLSGGASIISGALALIAAFGLFTLASWAWWLAAIVLIVRMAADVLAIVTMGFGHTLATAAVVNLIVSAFVLWYFTRPSVQQAFGR